MFAGGAETVDESLDEDPKNVLQEYTQSQFAELPQYAIVATQGPPHARTFTAEVSLGERVLGTGSGPTKKEAQRRAAAGALESLEEPPG